VPPPIDEAAALHEVMLESERYGFQRVKQEQQELGRRVRAMLAEKGFASVAGTGFETPGGVVSYADDPELQSGKKSSSRSALRPLPVCRCSATSRRIVAAFASAFSGWTSCAIPNVRFAASRSW